ncbi:MAG: YqgE/AlgH family protein [Gammaproteobacteria bacterium]|nr:YqgE/AlgH family protein [Gammaproteobacteria bacterium]
MNFTNQFLVAMPNLADPNFAKTVTYILAHSEDGAMGLVINRPLEVNFGDLLEHMNIDTARHEIKAKPIMQGGPVEPQRGFVVHEPGGNWDAVMQVEDGLAVAWSKDILVALSEGSGPQRTLVTLGYAGWGAGQLENEVLDNSWLNGPADANIIFDCPYEQRWENAARLMGVDIERLSGTAGHS